MDAKLGAPVKAAMLAAVAIIGPSLAANSKNEWVSVWTPPKPALGGMESFVDSGSIRNISGQRRATWRMIPWTEETYAKAHPTTPSPKAVIRVVLVSFFDCDKELMRDQETTMYFQDGSDNAGVIRAQDWRKPVGATHAVFDYVCGAVIPQESDAKP